MPNKLTQAEFVAKAVAAHGVGRYDYSQAIYVTGKTKVRISCPTHGLFEQEASSHLSGCGCPACGYTISGAAQRKWDTASFVTRCQELHPRLSFARSVFSTIDAKIDFDCPLHGPQSITASRLLNGNVCRACGNEKLRGSRKAAEAWLAEFAAVHGDYYDYSKVLDSFGAAGMYTIICPQHGEFKQEAYNHALGQGCPECSLANRGFSRSEWTTRAVGKAPQLYLIKCYSETEEFYKIGLTFRSVATRFSSGFPYSYQIIKIIENREAGVLYDLEKRLKKQLSHLRYIPRVTFAGETECFTALAPILSALPS